VTNIIITGGAGFIGSNLVRHVVDATSWNVVVLDALTYSGNLRNLEGVLDGGRCTFVHGSITDVDAVRSVLQTYAPEYVINCAAETHVDRSVYSMRPFVETNVLGTGILLEESRRAGVKRFVQVSTDEVYGSLNASEPRFLPDNPLRPSSAYAASKASADLLVLADVHTHGTDAVVTRCSNNYGPYQFPEKLVPLMILNALEHRPLPIYGDGLHIRDWIYVRDHCAGILAALTLGIPGNVYLFGGDTERSNIEIVQRIVDLTQANQNLITYVQDRPGHDRRYAVDTDASRLTLHWQPTTQFEQGLADTVQWYIDNMQWCNIVRDGSYRQYYENHYARLSTEGYTTQ